MSSLKYSPIKIDDFDRIYKYTSLYGNGSCQHSPVSMWSLYEKYGDSVCEQDGFLYTLREHICDSKYRVYLAPLGEGDKEDAYRRIMEDASTYEKKVKFFTLTEHEANYLGNIFPGRFDIEKDRDYAEYIFSAKTFAEFPGKVHARRRTEIRSFWREYGSCAESNIITESDYEEIVSFAEYWLETNAETHDETALKKELNVIKRQIEHYNELNLSGTVIRINGRIKGFCYGAALNDSFYDVLIEKGDRKVQGIYRVLRQESTRLNVSDFEYINFEEDIGVPGLRRLKESYGPAFMIDKYSVTER